MKMSPAPNPVIAETRSGLLAFDWPGEERGELLCVRRRGPVAVMLDEFRKSDGRVMYWSHRC